MRRAGVILFSHPEINGGRTTVIVKFLAASQASSDGSLSADTNPQIHSLNFDPAEVSTESMDLLLEFMTVRENSFWVTPDPKRKKILAMERHEDVESLIHALEAIKANGARRQRQRTT